MPARCVASLKSDWLKQRFIAIYFKLQLKAYKQIALTLETHEG